MNYNNLYKSNKNVWGQAPNKLLEMVWNKAEQNSYFLDLGAGQGRDSIFMAQKGFNVIAIDESEEGIKNLQTASEELGLNNIEAICQKIEDCKIEKNKFSIINAINIFQFLDKSAALKIIEVIKQNIKIGGYAIISGFTIQDPSFNSKNDKGYFELNELSEIFKDFEIIFYNEAIVEDPAHAGANASHKHGVVKLIAKKL